MKIRESIIDEIKLLSQLSEQIAYEKSFINAGHAPTELVSVFCDDLYNPKNEDLISAFSNEELKELANLYGLMVEASNEKYLSVSDMLKNPKWRKVIELAKRITTIFRYQWLKHGLIYTSAWSRRRESRGFT
jgi:hypothetical protein